MALSDLLSGASVVTIFPTLAVSAFISLLLHRAFFHPLKNVPGPFICRLTSLWTYYHSYIGDECTLINEFHQKYGPIVRIAPNEVVLSDGSALAPIYSDKGGFLKAACYKNFDIEGHSTIFSELDPAHRAVRSKAVLPMFSFANIRGEQDVLQGCVDRYIERLKEEADTSRQARKETGKAQKINMLNLSRSLAVDAVSSYLFRRSFDAASEKGERMSASAFVDVLVAFGRFFFLPNWIFTVLEQAASRLHPDPEVGRSMAKVGGFTRSLAEKSSSEDTTYQGRLRKAGLTDHEIKIQCEDLIFAGTDSTGMNLSTICWSLARNPEIYKKLQAAVAEADKDDPQSNPQGIPYLDAVVREGLRLSMANPTRLPRVVPPQGWIYTTPDGKISYALPAGSLVSLQIFTLHLNPDVYPDPLTFKPERWLKDVTPEMQRDWIPFGLGPRQCIARNLAHVELLLATRSLARHGILQGAQAVEDKIQILEWFNSRVVGERIDLIWT